MTPQDVYNTTYIPMCQRVGVPPAGYEVWYALSERLFGRQDLTRLESDAKEVQPSWIDIDTNNDRWFNENRIRWAHQK